MSMQPMFVMIFEAIGAQAADIVWDFEAPFDFTIHKVFAAASNDSSATLIVGTSADTNGYITSYAIGDSYTPVRKESLSDFNGALVSSQYPHVSDGTRVTLTLDHDGDSGTSASNVLIMLVCSPG